MPVMLSSRNREVSLGSPSSPVRCRTLHAMLKDCSKSSVSLILYKLSVNQRVPTQHRGFRAAASIPVDHPSHPSPAPRFQSGGPSQQRVTLDTSRCPTGLLTQPSCPRCRTVIETIDCVASFLFHCRFPVRRTKAWGPRSRDREHTARLQSHRQFLADSGG